MTTSDGADTNKLDTNITNNDEYNANKIWQKIPNAKKKEGMYNQKVLLFSRNEKYTNII